MYLVPIAWIYVVLLMSVAEATNSNGTVIGAIVTFMLYGMTPVGLILYFMGTPGRRRAIRAREAAERAAAVATADLGPPDAGGHAAADAVTPVGKEP